MCLSRFREGRKHIFAVRCAMLSGRKIFECFPSVSCGFFNNKYRLVCFMSYKVIDSRVRAKLLVSVGVITFSAAVRRNLHNFRSVEVSSFLANCCWYITI